MAAVYDGDDAEGGAGMKFWRAGDGEAYAGYNRETRRLFVCGGAVWELLMEKLVERHEGEAGSRLEGL